MAAGFLLTFGFVGAFAGHRLRMPAGVLFGTLLGVAGGGMLLGVAPVPVPSEVNGLLQVMVGILVGLGISRDSLRSGVRALLPASLLAVAAVSTGIASALLAVYLTPIGFPTALFAAVPGGLTEMSTVSASFSADGAVVATVHLVRLLLVVAGVNVLLAGLRLKGRLTLPVSSSWHRSPVPDEKREGLAGSRRLGAAALCGVAGGLLGIAGPVPAGGIIGALAGSAIFCLFAKEPVQVAKFQLAVQALSGTVIGLGISADFFSDLLQLAGAGGLMIATQMLLWLLMSRMLVSLFGYDLVTATFASAPGGMVEIVSTASQAGVSVVIVAFTHLVRLSAIVVFVPVLIASVVVA